MKWEELKETHLVDTTMCRYIKTDVECPQCGTCLMKRTDIILTCYPPQYQYHCPKCGFVGTNY